jgi:outer membrane protein assembly factor BamB
LLSTPLVYAFNPLTKHLLWQGGSNVTGIPALAEGVLLLIDDGALTARDATTGDLLWTATDTAELLYAPVVAHGFAYAASATDTYAVDLKSGAVVWQAEGGGWLSIGGGRLVVAGDSGILRSYVLTQPATP